MSTTLGGARPELPLTARTLGAIVDHSQQLDQVRKSDLRYGDWVVIETKNSVYSLCALGEDQYAVTGGWFDSHESAPLTVAVNGCTWGGSAIKSDILAAPGLFLEFSNRVRTTRIQRVELVRGDRNPLPLTN